MRQSSGSQNLPITLDQLRSLANKFLSCSSFGMTIICSLTAFFGHQNVAITFGISLTATVVAILAIKIYKEDLPARIIVSVTLAVQVMMLIFSASNLDASHVQEAHMLYFVLNCYILSYACWRSILLYNAVVVLHHVIFTLIVPGWIWTAGEASGGMSHLLLHASIALMLVGPLMLVAEQLRQMIDNTHGALAAAREAKRLEVAAEMERTRVATLDERRKSEEARVIVASEQAHVVEIIGAGLASLSAGDLTALIKVPFAKDYESLRENFNNATHKLQDTMTRVIERSNSLRVGASEITSASDDLARRTEQQAASLEETATAVDQITSTVKRTADGAVEARDAVARAKDDAERSGEIVQDAVRAMIQIEDSSRKVSQIIGVIDGIAFQTNLLALNAGVEAARAGEAGRGFAVVALEVRALAQRSSEAAKEIKSLILASTNQVAYGVQRVGETGKSLQRIAAQVTEIETVVNEIADSAREQAMGLNEVNTAINQMDQVTQQNAAMVEEATAAAHSLREEVDAVSDLIAQFRVDKTMSVAATSRTSARKPNIVHALQRNIARRA